MLRASFVIPVTGRKAVMVQADTVWISAPYTVNNLLRPVIVSVACAAGYFQYSVAGIIFTEGLIFSVFVSVKFGRHISAAAPVFISDAYIFKMPRLFSAVFLSLFCKRGISVIGYVFNPALHFPNSAAGHICRKIRLASEFLAKVKKLMRAEGISFFYSAPAGVYSYRTVFFRTYTVLPMILLGKATAGPA